MTFTPFRVLRAARALWTRDRAVLLPLTGLFLFVPQWAILLLVPEVPAMVEAADAEAAMTAWSAAISSWFAANALFYLVAGLLSQFGTLAVATLYLGSGAGSAGTAMARAAAVFGRYLLALMLVWIPLVLAGSVLLSAGGFGLVAAVGPLLYLLALALLMLVGPAIAAGESGAMRAVTRVWAITRGHRLQLVALAAILAIAAQVVAAVLLGIAHSLRAGGMENPVATALLDAGAAGASWASSVGLALSGVVAYRALVR